MNAPATSGSPSAVGAPVRGAQVCPVLIGREDVLALAARRHRAAAAGTGQVLFLAGEAGIGKTRLLTEIADRAAGEGFAVVSAVAFPGDLEVAGGVLADLAADLRRSPASAGAGTRIAERLRAGGDGDAHRQQRTLAIDVAEAIGSLGHGSGPVLVALEDLHWADGLTLKVLERVGRQLRNLPILVVGTYRSDELYPRVPMRSWRARLLTQRIAEEVRLPRLNRDDTGSMIAAIADNVLPSAVAAAVFARSDGIPLHVEEFFAMANGTDPHREVPDTLADAVRVRAQLLTGPARALAGAASVIGRSFDVDLLTAITGEATQVVDEGLRELTERFFVRPHPDKSSYDFRHALIRDALYADVTPHRRRELHARTAESAAGFGDAYVSDQYERARQPALAYRHALAGAAGAAAISAHREAVELFRRAQRTTPVQTSGPQRAELLAALAAELAAIDDNTAAAASYTEAYVMHRGLGDDAAAAALVPALVAVRHLLGASLSERVALLREALSIIAARSDDGVNDARARIHAALSAAYMLDRRLDEAVENGECARSLATTIGDQGTRWNIDATLGSVLVFAGRMDDGWRLLEEAIGHARNAREEAEAARGYRMIGSCASVLVEYDRGLRWLREGIGYAERAERFNDRNYMAAHLAHVLWATGDWPAAEREARNALADGRGITTQITALHALGYLALGRGDWPSAETHLTEAAELGGQMRELQRISPAQWGLAETAFRRNRLEEAIEWCERGYAASAAVSDAAYLFPYLLTGTRAYLAFGDSKGARDWVERGVRLLRHRGIPGTLAAVHHAHGLLHLHDGQTSKAREALDLAATRWAQRQRFWEGTQAIIDQAHCAARSRRPVQAATLAHRAQQRAAAAGAATLLDTVEGLTRAGNHSPDAPRLLTAREAEVARLVATGATNRQIAEALFIAPKTVASHIEHILTKLGAARRAQIAAWSASQPAAGRADD